MTTKEAMDHLRQQFITDEGYRMAWIANLACAAMDHGVDQKTANEIAERFMGWAFPAS